MEVFRAAFDAKTNTLGYILINGYRIVRMDQVRCAGAHPLS